MQATNIEWCDSTFNPWIGCTKVSPGCDHCYAEADMDQRRHRVKWGAGQARSRTSADYWKQMGRWNRQGYLQCVSCGWRGEQRKGAGMLGDQCRNCGGTLKNTRRRVFCASLADIFDNAVPIEWLVDFLEVCRTTPNMDKLLLTKRIGNVLPRLREALAWIAEEGQGLADELATWLAEWLGGNPPRDIWLGATIVNQDEADRDISKLLAIPAWVRFLSMEPLLSAVTFRYDWSEVREVREDGKMMAYCTALGAEALRMMRERGTPIHWIITGYESGHKARPGHPDWAWDIMQQARQAGVALLHKQNGEWAHPGLRAFGKFKGTKVVAIDSTGKILQPPPSNEEEYGDAISMSRVGKKRTGRELGDRIYSEFPKVAYA